MFAVIFSQPASAAKANKLATPQISEFAVYSDRITVSIDNYAKYPSGTKLKFFIGSTYIKAVSAKNCEAVNFYDDGSKYFTADKVYKISVKAIIPGDDTRTSEAASIKLRTDTQTYFTLKKGTGLYKYSSGKMVLKAKSVESGYVLGLYCTAKGQSVAGKSIEKYSGEYVRIRSGSYTGYYIKITDTSRILSVKAKRQIVSQYGASMNGGSYVWGGTAYRRTDCSGLTMQCYKQIGVNLSHNAAAQAYVGKSVSVSAMEPGDIIVMNYGSHVGMYIGSGKIVHALNSRVGIRIDSVEKLRYYHVDTVRRIIY
jgi:cell wall-associated NlpC family hydrolase